jgi:hypothetical protein
VSVLAGAQESLQEKVGDVNAQQTWLQILFQISKLLSHAFQSTYSDVFFFEKTSS